MDNFLFLPRAFASGLFDLAFAAALGSLLSLLWVGAASFESNGTMIVELLRRTVVFCAAAMLLLLGVQLWLLTATMLGNTSSHEIRTQLGDVLSGTHSGRILMPQTLAVVLLLVAASLRRLMAHAFGVYAGIMFSAAMICFRAASGHAAAQGNFTLAEAAQFLHLASIAIWAGGVLIAGLIVIPELVRSRVSLSDLTRCAHRLSSTCSWAVFAVVITGLYKGWMGLGESLHPLEHTQWGTILMAKGGLVAMALAIGLKNRLTLKRNATLVPSDAITFSKWLHLEALAMIAILFLSAFLANSPPVMDC